MTYELHTAKSLAHLSQDKKKKKKTRLFSVGHVTYSTTAYNPNERLPAQSPIKDSPRKRTIASITV